MIKKNQKLFYLIQRSLSNVVMLGFLLMNRILTVLDLVVYFLHIQSSSALLTYCIQFFAGCMCRRPPQFA